MSCGEGRGACRASRLRGSGSGSLAAAEAAAAALAPGTPSLPAESLAGCARGLTAGAAALGAALDAFDEPAAQAVLDRLLDDFTPEPGLAEAVLPYLRELGQRWADGQASVACEHFASNIIRGRLAGLARRWGQGQGPRALLACPPGEVHELGLMTFGVALHRRGWRVHYLGTDTPVAELARAARDVSPDLAVLAAVTPGRYQPHVAELSRLAAEVPLALAGAGATLALARAAGARLLAGDPVTEACDARARAG